MEFFFQKHLIASPTIRSIFQLIPKVVSITISKFSHLNGESSVLDVEQKKKTCKDIEVAHELLEVYDWFDWISLSLANCSV